MNRWHDYLFGPVAALRPRMFAQLFLAVLALDLWLNFMHRGPNLGVGGFVVAHFQWLDELQPVPTPGLYIGMMIVASFALWTAALCGGHRLLIALAGLLFTYGWMMSQTDSFQHHYLLSLILLCVTFFPKPESTASATPARRTLIVAWAYVMLGAQVGIVYFWTAVTKFDPAWLRGDVVQRLCEHPAANPLLTWSVNSFTALTGASAWPVLAVAGLATEILLALGYFLAVGQDRRTSRWSRITSIGLWILTLFLHVGILLMPLAIGLFGYHMLVVGTVFLLPLPWLELLQRFLIDPTRRVGGWLRKLMNPWQSRTLCAVEAVVAAAGVGLVAWRLELPGSLAAGCISAGILLVWTVIDLLRGRLMAAQQRILSTLLFIALMAGIMFGGNLRQRVDMKLAYMQHMAGTPLLALEHYSRVAVHGPSPAVQAGLFNNIGDILCRLHDYPKAIDWYKNALVREPDNGSFHANIALALVTLRRYDEAAEHYSRALELDCRTSTVHYNYGFALQNLNLADEAIEQYRSALKFDPDMRAAHNNLTVLLLKAQDVGQAQHHLRQVLRLDPQDVNTMNNLAWMLATKSDRTAAESQEALTLATQAVALTKRQNAIVLGTLAEAQFAMGLRAEAQATALEAVNAARTQKLPDVESQIRGRLERYQP